MAEQAKPTKLTYDDFLLFPDDGKRHELIDGVHYVTASPSTAHQRALGNLHWEIRRYLSENPIGEVFLSPLDIVLSRFDVVEPDLFYVGRERAAIVGPANLRGAPDLVVEILSPSTEPRDRKLKKRLYESRGVREYWLVDAAAETIEVLRSEAGRFRDPSRLTVSAGDRLRTPLLPGCDIPLDAIFRAPGPS